MKMINTRTRKATCSLPTRIPINYNTEEVSSINRRPVHSFYFDLRELNSSSNMAEQIQKRKRSSEHYVGKAVIKRQVSARTQVANKLESCLHLGNSSPRVMADQVPSLPKKFKRAQIENLDDPFFLDRKVSKKNSSTKESKPDIERERCSESEQEDHCLSEDLEKKDVSFSQVQVPVKPQTTEAEEGVEKEGCDEPEQEDHCLSEDLENADVSFSQVQVVNVPIIPVKPQATEAEEGVEKEGCDEPEQEDHCLSEDLENADVSFSQVQVVNVPSIPDNTDPTTEAEEGVEEEGCDEPDGLFGIIHHHHDDDDYELDGFSVHLPAHFHRFADPCPFGARLNKSEKGYKLARVLTNTAAYTAGLRESDTLTHLNDTELHTLDISEIQKLFMHIETTFTLTILRKYGEGDEVHLEKTTIRVNIDDEVVVEIVHTEIICSERPINTSALSFISQDENDVSQIYLNATGEIVTMGGFTDARAQFYLDFYRGGQGQRCAIRHHNTNRLYDAVQNSMKLMEDPYNPDLACMLDKIHRSDGTFVFESVELQGNYQLN
ncbi:uncharacterized protein LOC105446168 isoform X2 [Strongylocentrotus purpuratus]|uniref:PDZ domain-containing protein n=1 Tax=Strongylocentrotus purpuratus TaxID=7668 RepID=A0A7M7SWZ8_STRPU|nr:uncharacterized protein LOC105446168 isoform X2 [Strongylocentrotus purpuratus]